MVAKFEWVLVESIFFGCGEMLSCVPHKDLDLYVQRFLDSFQIGCSTVDGLTEEVGFRDLILLTYTDTRTESESSIQMVQVGVCIPHAAIQRMAREGCPHFF